MLGTYTLTLPTGNTVRCTTASGHQTLIEVLRSPVIRITPQSVYGPENIRYTDPLRASVTAILTGRTAYLGHAQNVGRNLIYDPYLILSHRLKILKGIDVIIHLVLAGHSR